MNSIKMQLMVREEPEIARKINTLLDEHLEGKKVVMVTGHRPQHLWGFNFLTPHSLGNPINWKGTGGIDPFTVSAPCFLAGAANKLETKGQLFP